MAKLIILMALAYFGISEASPNFGLSVSFAPTSAITTGLSTFTSALTTLSGAISSLPSSSTNANVTIISTNLSQFVKNLIVVANYVKGNVTVALSDTKTDTSTLFSNIFSGIDALNTYLMVDGNNYITLISGVLTSSPALNQVIDQVIQFQNSLTSIITTFSNMEIAIFNAIAAAGTGSVTTTIANAQVPATFGTSISADFTSIKGQLANMTTNIKGISTAVVASNTYITSITSTIASATKSINSTELTFQKSLTSLNTTAVTYYTKIMTTVISDLKTVSSKLSIYAKDTTLGAMVTSWSSAVGAAINSSMAQMIASGTDTINYGLSTLYTQTDTMVQNASAFYASTVLSVATSLASQVMSLGTTGPACSSKYSSAISSALSTAQSGLSACVSAEQTKAAAVMDIIVRMGQLALASDQYITNMIISCGSYSNFAKDPNVYNQALACMETLIASADSINALYSTIVQPELDMAASLMALEVDMANTRLRTCLTLQNNIFMAQINTVAALIAACT
ncbi:uncharacterized protein LOC131685612 [Topomyia yanbarensis]|uniref:uncharacterized protein LOC131685612 n=1 Tax=Topomyia yanbarensis TaxID=2498891 RepID=UPI00273CDFA8|nr:uncharacterized protein LOC131685612 [Topomyia yanbarensis]